MLSPKGLNHDRADLYDRTPGIHNRIRRPSTIDLIKAISRAVPGLVATALGTSGCAHEIFQRSPEHLGKEHTEAHGGPHWQYDQYGSTATPIPTPTPTQIPTSTHTPTPTPTPTPSLTQTSSCPEWDHGSWSWPGKESLDLEQAALNIVEESGFGAVFQNRPELEAYWRETSSPVSLATIGASADEGNPLCYLVYYAGGDKIRIESERNPGTPLQDRIDICTQNIRELLLAWDLKSHIDCLVRTRPELFSSE